jgi:hypothetical protein
MRARTAIRAVRAGSSYPRGTRPGESRRSGLLSAAEDPCPETIFHIGNTLSVLEAHFVKEKLCGLRDTYETHLLRPIAVLSPVQSPTRTSIRRVHEPGEFLVPAIHTPPNRTGANELLR